MINQFLKEKKAYFYAVFRILVGLLFFFHGAQKFGFMGETYAFPTLWPMGIAGIVEVLVGLALVLGVFVSWASILGAIQMLVAYFMVHAPKGWYPLKNGGEAALLFFAAFLILAAVGAGSKWSLQQSE